LTFKGSPEHNTEKEYRKLAKSKEITTYLKKGGEVTPGLPDSWS
jgi:hypothetical protein